MVTCCAIGGGSDFAASVYERSTPRAAKAHQCAECECEITRGVRHEYVKGLWDGQWRSYRTCTLCVEIRDHFACEDGFLHGEVWSDLECNLFPTMVCGGRCMRGLSPAAKACLIERRLAWLLKVRWKRRGAYPAWHRHAGYRSPAPPSRDPQMELVRHPYTGEIIRQEVDDD